MVGCAICKHYSSGHPCSFFKLPADKLIRAKWLQLIGTEICKTRKDVRVCACHFVDGEKKNLPTLNIKSIKSPNHENIITSLTRGVIKPEPVFIAVEDYNSEINAESVFTADKDGETETNSVPESIDPSDTSYIMCRLCGLVGSNRFSLAGTISEKLNLLCHLKHYLDIDVFDEEDLPLHVCTLCSQNIIAFYKFHERVKTATNQLQAIVNKIVLNPQLTRKSLPWYADNILATATATNGYSTKKHLRQLEDNDKGKTQAASTQVSTNITKLLENKARNNEIKTELIVEEFVIKEENAEDTNDGVNSENWASLESDPTIESIPKLTPQTDKIQAESLLDLAKLPIMTPKPITVNNTIVILNSPITDAIPLQNDSQLGKTQLVLAKPPPTTLKELIIVNNPISLLKSPVTGEKLLQNDSQIFPPTLEKNLDIHPPNSEEVQEVEYICNICDVRCKQKIDLIKHKRNHFEGTFVCNFCHKEFTNYPCFIEHQEMHQKEKRNLIRRKRIRSGKKSEKHHLCHICGKKFIRSYDLTRHKLVHTNERPYVCLICDKKFLRYSSLVSHKRTHSGERPYKCTICNKSFTLQQHLRYHKRIHTGEKPFSCIICHKTFRQIADLIKHGRTHTGERPYSCDVCDKTFSQQDYLMKHKIIHTGEKPYKCNICAKEFSDSSNFARHKKIHTGNYRFPCDICKKVFTQRSSLRVHLERVHNGENIYACGVCNKKFLTQNHLDNHKKIHS